VVRTENLCATWEILIDLLGGDGFFVLCTVRVSREEHHKSRHHPFRSHAKLLCCALQDELNIFRDLVIKGTNLDDETKLEVSIKTARVWSGIMGGS
jgi:hypothetical protein